MSLATLSLGRLHNGGIDNAFDNHDIEILRTDNVLHFDK